MSASLRPPPRSVRRASPGRVAAPLLAPLLVITLLAGACGSGAPVRERTYTEQAEQVFYEGEEALDDGNYPYAMQLFRRVRDSYELSTWATLAELRIGDVFFEQGDYRQAAEVFRTFIQLHPNHGAVGYARFRIGMAYYEDMPSDFFLLPPAYERELGSTRLAEQTLADFLRRHGEETEQPMAGYVVEARAAYQEALDRLAGYEFYLAEFYLERERPVAAATHLRTLLQDFPDSSLAPDSLFLLARCYVELADVVSALEAIQTLESRFPAHRLTERARGWMERNALDFSLIPEPS